MMINSQIVASNSGSLNSKSAVGLDPDIRLSINIKYSIVCTCAHDKRQLTGRLRCSAEFHHLDRREYDQILGIHIEIISRPNISQSCFRALKRCDKLKHAQPVVSRGVKCQIRYAHSSNGRFNSTKLPLCWPLHCVLIKECERDLFNMKSSQFAQHFRAYRLQINFVILSLLTDTNLHLVHMRSVSSYSYQN